jgi:hypothetical protein
MKVKVLLIVLLITLSVNLGYGALNPKIDPYAVSKITKSQYPKLYAKWGANGFKKINTLAPRAAEKAAMSPECDRVALVEVSDNRSVPGKEIVFFVDCENGKRFYISEFDLKAGGPIQSQTKKMAVISDAQAISLCENAVKARLNNPLSYSRKFGTTSVYRAETTGGIVVQFEFSAQNGFGAELPRRARCVIVDQKGIEVTITPK